MESYSAATRAATESTSAGAGDIMARFCSGFVSDVMYTLPIELPPVCCFPADESLRQMHGSAAIVVEFDDLFGYSPVEFKDRRHPGYFVAGAFVLSGSIDGR